MMFGTKEIIEAIDAAMTRRFEILIKHGMEPIKARQRVLKELEKSLNRLMKDFVFPEEMGSEARLDLDEDGE